jgi:hypothetical protein
MEASPVEVEVEVPSQYGSLFHINNEVRHDLVSRLLSESVDLGSLKKQAMVEGLGGPESKERALMWKVKKSAFCLSQW